MSFYAQLDEDGKPIGQPGATTTLSFFDQPSNFDKSPKIFDGMEKAKEQPPSIASISRLDKAKPTTISLSQGRDDAVSYQPPTSFLPRDTTFEKPGIELTSFR